MSERNTVHKNRTQYRYHEYVPPTPAEPVAKEPPQGWCPECEIVVDEAHMKHHAACPKCYSNQKDSVLWPCNATGKDEWHTTTPTPTAQPTGELGTCAIHNTPHVLNLECRGWQPPPRPVTGAPEGTYTDEMRREAKRRRDEDAQYSSESAHLQTIDERDHFEEVITNCAIAAGCTEEWSSVHEHGNCIIEELHRLKSSPAGARELAEATARELIAEGYVDVIGQEESTVKLVADIIERAWAGEGKNGSNL